MYLLAIQFTYVIDMVSVVVEKKYFSQEELCKVRDRLVNASSHWSRFSKSFTALC